MRRKITVYGLRFSKTTFWNRLNTGFLEPAVATALTACGIETLILSHSFQCFNMLQQHLPLAVLKRSKEYRTAYWAWKELQQHLPLAVLKRTRMTDYCPLWLQVATALTACGIETLQLNHDEFHQSSWSCNSTYRLRYWNHLAMTSKQSISCKLQQHLPLAVLKLNVSHLCLRLLVVSVATALTACGIETLPVGKAAKLLTRLQQHLPLAVLKPIVLTAAVPCIEQGCNSTYRLRYWNLAIIARHNCRLICCNSTYRLRYWNKIKRAPT